MTSRREFLQTGAAVAGSAFFFGGFSSSAESAVVAGTPFSTKLGWKIGPQIYSFNRFPFAEAIKKVQATGAGSFELYSGQKLSRDVDVRVGPDLLKPENKDALKLFKDLLAETGCKPHAMGVCPADRAHFDFAAAIGFSVINAEPKFDKIDEVGKLAEEYKFHVGLHNHPKASIYWDPQIVVDHLKNASPRIGACADTGHWLRSDLNPVECLRKLKGHLVSFHIKDLKKTADGKLDADCVMGQGAVGIADVLKEVAAQGFKGPFSIEFEAAWDNNVQQVADSVVFFEETAKEIFQAKSPIEKARLNRNRNIFSRLRSRLGG
ncbi:MAG: sugar phosphate isomerase/epimerase [Planctomycetaceae bacterium]|nr:sugar phosphate isomerase/epimerase [Planctomycetaceae bacterium]